MGKQAGGSTMTHNREPKPCKHCGKDFLATNPNQKYCTPQ